MCAVPSGIARGESNIERTGDVVADELAAAVFDGFLAVAAHSIHIAREDGLVRACGCAVHIDVDLARLLSDDAVVLRLVRIRRR